MFSGNLADRQLPAVLGQLAEGRATGCLHLSRPDGDGARIYLSAGRVSSITAPPTTAPAAGTAEPGLAHELAGLLAWTRGTWRLRLNERPDRPAPASVPVAELLMSLDIADPLPAHPVRPTVATREPLVDAVAAGVVRATAALTSFLESPQPARPEDPGPLDAATIAALESELTASASGEPSTQPIHVGALKDDDDMATGYEPPPTDDLPTARAGADRPIAYQPPTDEPRAKPGADRSTAYQPATDVPRARAGADLAALMGELTALGAEDEPVHRAAGSLVAAAVERKRHKGLFGR